MMLVVLRKGLLLSILVVFYVTSYSTLLNYNAVHAIVSQRSKTMVLPPLVLKVLAGEFKGLVADLIILDVGAQLGMELKRDGKEGHRIVKKQYRPE